MTNFHFTDVPVNSKLLFKGKPIKSFHVSVDNRHATINEANEFLKKTMKTLYERYGLSLTQNKKYQTSYKLSDGRWYSSSFFYNNTDTSAIYPDLRDEEYSVDHSVDMVEFIKISMVDLT